MVAGGEDQNSFGASLENISSHPFVNTEQVQSGSDVFNIVENSKSSGESRRMSGDSKGEISTILAAFDEKPKKKKKTRGLPISVRAFKSRSERDPELINEDLKVKFTDVIAEPEGYYTPKFSWNLSQEVYGFGKGCCYTFSSFFCGIPLAFIWGVWFALLACLNVWCLVPLIRSNSIKMSCWKSFWTVLVSSCCDPIHHSIGLIFNNMNVQTEKHIV